MTPFCCIADDAGTRNAAAVTGRFEPRPRWVPAAHVSAPGAPDAVHKRQVGTANLSIILLSFCSYKLYLFTFQNQYTLE